MVLLSNKSYWSYFDSFLQMVEQEAFRLWLFRNRASTTVGSVCFFFNFQREFLQAWWTPCHALQHVWLLSTHFHVNSHGSSVYIGWCLRNNEGLSPVLHLSCRVASLPVGKRDFMVIFSCSLSLSLLLGLSKTCAAKTMETDALPLLNHSQFNCWDHHGDHWVDKQNVKTI